MRTWSEIYSVIWRLLCERRSSKRTSFD